jgi:carboxylesterase type B
MYEPGRPLACGNEDHVLALEWVRDNISAFGGDAGNVTISGQSAGGYNTQLLLDLRPDLYRRAIVQSSPASMAFKAGDAADIAETIRSNLPEGKTPLSASIEELLAAQNAVAAVHKSKVAQFAPVIADGVAPGGRRKVQHSHASAKDLRRPWMTSSASTSQISCSRTHRLRSQNDCKMLDIPSRPLSISGRQMDTF